MKKFAGQMRAILAGAILAAVAGTGVPLMAGDLTVIHAFGPWPDPVQAVGRLLVGSDGRLYGVIAGDGQWGGGSAYRLNQNGENFQVLANFIYSQLGQEPKSGLVQTQDGLLFGTTVMGSKGGGNLFSFGSDGAGAVVRYPFNSVTEAFQLVGDLLKNGTVAQGLIEVYDVSRDIGSRLTNVSCRFNMNPGQLVILGTALIGDPVHILARNVGPGLAPYLSNPDGVLPDPFIRVYRGQIEVGHNNEWDDSAGAYFGSTGAVSLPVGSKDAAIRTLFSAGGYTVHATDNTGGGGIALIELYESQ